MDDRASVADLLADVLGRGGFAASIDRVASREAFVRALGGPAADVVLSNLSAPGLDALDALALLKDADPDLPFLVVSDRLDEEATLRALRAGARDCVSHASVSRLVPVVERALGETRVRRERRQAQQALSESELRLRDLAEACPDAVLFVDGTGALLFANRAAEALFGHPVAALIGRPAASLLPGIGASAPAGRRTASEACLASGGTLAVEISAGEIARDGRRLSVVFVRPAGSPAGEGARASSEELFRRAALMAADLVQECDRAAGTITWHGDVDRVLGFAPGAFPRTAAASAPPPLATSRPASRSSRSTAFRRGTAVPSTGTTRRASCPPRAAARREASAPWRT
ncbi:MAG TPA: response regulator [Thermoanaerobaculia bacterium]|nr:response regulator [Thermoanaerobaculia bacterium]